MQKAVVIGGRGKVGTYLVPMLVREGFEVVTVTRGQTEPYEKDTAWEQVTQLTIARNETGFEQKIQMLRPDVVVDMICYQNADMLRLIETLRGVVSHYLVCGTLWIHGHCDIVPTREDDCREPLEPYGVQKNLMALSITKEFAERGFPGTIIHPGHITCPGDIPINPQGCKSLEAFRILKAGKPLYLPYLGMETVQHVHAKDLAAAFMAAIKIGGPSFGEGFHIVAEQAITLRGFASAAADWYGKSADLHFEDFETYKTRSGNDMASMTMDQVSHSLCCSIEKAKRILGFKPEYTILEAVKECVASFGLLK
jgi:nucleoside-diphosphate-sugar epimerase